MNFWHEEEDSSLAKHRRNKENMEKNGHMLWNQKAQERGKNNGKSLVFPHYGMSLDNSIWHYGKMTVMQLGE